MPTRPDTQELSALSTDMLSHSMKHKLARSLRIGSTMMQMRVDCYREDAKRARAQALLNCGALIVPSDSLQPGEIVVDRETYRIMQVLIDETNRCRSRADKALANAEQAVAEANAHEKGQADAPS